MSTSEDLGNFYNEIRRGKNDRIAEILACGVLDNDLKVAIYSALTNKAVALKLFEDGSPLHNFSAKIAMGHALGLYGKQTRRNLDILRDIRNLFAHEMTILAFATPEIAEACSQLIIPTAHKGLPVSHLRYDTPRDRYISTALITGHLIGMNSFGTWYEGEPEEIRPVTLP